MWILISDHFTRIWNLFGIIESHFGFRPYMMFCSFYQLVVGEVRFTFPWGDTWLLEPHGIYDLQNRCIYIMDYLINGPTNLCFNCILLFQRCFHISTVKNWNASKPFPYKTLFKKLGDYFKIDTIFYNDIYE